ncbi:MAG: hypothetical protein PUC41_05545 [Oscillospiraceae bacterium]|nr:hypothetical protein [Oscillospiraceae bacterium]
MTMPIQCLRCGAEMKPAMPVPSGTKHPLLREANRLMTQVLHITMYECTGCGKIEFFRHKSLKDT